MSGVLVLLLGAANLIISPNHTYTGGEDYYELDHFWTNVGFCPMGNINRKDITRTLLSDEIQQNLQHIAALPAGSVTHVRIHWLLELIEFVQFTQTGTPIYDFTNLDTFLMNLDDLGLWPVIEFMCNPGDVFIKNPNRNGFFWEDITYQVTRHYLNTFGAAKMLRWRFETWNEPDLLHYNRLNFTIEDYLDYVYALRRGLTAAGHRNVNSLYFPLRGPAGLFKVETKHPLCWTILQHCGTNLQECPFDVLTYHRKGNSSAGEVLATSSVLLKHIYTMFPQLQNLPISNDEADPIGGWSTPHDFQADVRYAHKLILIVLEHWHAKLKHSEFKTLESISHDNAFLSYHPHEFSQRTLLAHFRMNNTEPIHSQFIQKPVYAALALLSKLAPLAANVEIIPSNGDSLSLLKTTVNGSNSPGLYLSWLLVPNEHTRKFVNYTLQRLLPFEFCKDETYAFVVELLEQEHTDPMYVWQSYNRPAYPNASVREAMRRSQAPVLYSSGILEERKFEIYLGQLQMPWIILYRICSNMMPPLKQPQHLTASRITHNEVLLTWREIPNTVQCLKTYEILFQMSGDTLEWSSITMGWHVPFPSFQYAPTNGTVNGFYKVRGIDIFNSTSEFSQTVEYFEI